MLVGGQKLLFIRFAYLLCNCFLISSGNIKMSSWLLLDQRRLLLCKQASILKQFWRFWTNYSRILKISSKSFRNAFILSLQPNPIYNYAYQVSDDNVQTYIAHQEDRNGENVKGQYRWVNKEYFNHFEARSHSRMSRERLDTCTYLPT